MQKDAHYNTQQQETELQILKEKLNSLDDNYDLSDLLESCSKQLATYYRIIKPHFKELQQVMSLASHQEIQISAEQLPTALSQTISLLETVNQDDIDLLKSLARDSKNCYNSEDKEISDLTCNSSKESYIS